MLVRKKKNDEVGKEAISHRTLSDENPQSLRSWIHKIEQTTTSVSSRLSAVEKRLSGGKTEQNIKNQICLEGPVETLFLNGETQNAGEVARLLDGELCHLHNEVVQQEQQTCSLKDRLQAVEEMQTRIDTELQVFQAKMSKMSARIEQASKPSGRHEPLVMHLGAVEIPVELTGVVGGLLAFVVAILVFIDQKAVLLSPVFLVLVGTLLLGVALIKMVRSRSRPFDTSSFPIPLNTSAATVAPIGSERKE